jgi:hypothetical protein
LFVPEAVDTARAAESSWTAAAVVIDRERFLWAESD